MIASGVQFGAATTLTVSGTLNVNKPASFAVDESTGQTSESILVASGGVLNITGTNFSRLNGTNTASNTSTIEVNANGHLTANGATASTFGWDQFTLDNNSLLNSGDIAGCAFDTTVAVPALDVPLLAGNTTFQDVYINAGSSTGSTPLNLPILGSASTNQHAVFSGAFTIPAGSTVTIDSGVAVLLASGVEFGGCHGDNGQRNAERDQSGLVRG